MLTVLMEPTFAMFKLSTRKFDRHAPLPRCTSQQRWIDLGCLPYLDSCERLMSREELAFTGFNLSVRTIKRPASSPRRAACTTDCSFLNSRQGRWRATSMLSQSCGKMQADVTERDGTMPLSAVIQQAILRTSSQEDTGTTTTHSLRTLSNYERNPTLSTPHHTLTTPQTNRTICHSRRHETLTLVRSLSPGLVG